MTMNERFKGVRIFSTDSCSYVVVPTDGGFVFNYTTKPYTRSGRQPITNGSFFKPAAEAEAFIKEQTRCAY
jgi:hypothetical protein